MNHGSLHHVELWVPDLVRACQQWGWARVDALTSEAPAHGWTLLFPGLHPHAGGPDHYAAYLVSTDGFEVELVATS
ncbi:MAG: hypothetical protein ABSA53_25565 [Streptosporangiaceae bacterium]